MTQDLKRAVNKDLLRRLIRSEKGAKIRIANEVGISPHTLSYWMTDQYTSSPREYHCIGVAAALGVDVDALFPAVGAVKKRKAG